MLLTTDLLGICDDTQCTHTKVRLPPKHLNFKSRIDDNVTRNNTDGTHTVGAVG